MCYPSGHENNRCPTLDSLPTHRTPLARGDRRPRRGIARRRRPGSRHQPLDHFRLVGPLSARRMGTARRQEARRSSPQARQPGPGLDLQGCAEGSPSIQVQVRSLDERDGSGHHPPPARRFLGTVFGLPSSESDGTFCSTASLEGLSAGFRESRALASNRISGDTTQRPEHEGRDLVCGRDGSSSGLSCGDDLGTARPDADCIDDGRSVQNQFDLGRQPEGRFSVYGRRGEGDSEGYC